MTNARWVESDALIWMTPPAGPVVFQVSGSPRRSTNQSATTDSSSVAAGLVDHIIPCVDSPADTSSPRIDGGDELAGKNPNHPGDCQWVIPGMMISSRSRITSSKGSGRSGADSGSRALMSPGLTSGVMGRSSTLSR